MVSEKEMKEAMAMEDFLSTHGYSNSKNPKELDVELTEDKWDELVEVNRLVNERIEYAADIEAFGVDEYWELILRSGTGDCDDYAVTKQYELQKLGWSLKHLRLCTCNVETGGSHLVLIVQTNAGDYVLDNRYSKPHAWAELVKAGYTFQKLQIGASDRWVYVDPVANLI